jgi:type IV pilus assembly protein PilA
MLSKMTKKNEGFTLIELMIVIAIIGILAAIAIPQFAAYRVRGFNAAAQADLRNAATAQEAYYADWQTYTNDDTILGQSTYGFFPSTNVTLSFGTVDQFGYVMRTHHSSGNTTYTLTGPGGTVE